MRGIKHSSNGGAVPGKGGEGTWNTYHQSVRKVSALVYIRQSVFFQDLVCLQLSTRYARDRKGTILVQRMSSLCREGRLAQVNQRMKHDSVQK